MRHPALRMLTVLLLASVPVLEAHARPEAPSRRSATDARSDAGVMLRVRAGLLRAEDERNASDPAIAHALAHPVAAVRWRAVRALGRIGDAASVPRVTAALVDADASVRREAAFALGEIESPAAFMALARAAVSDDAELRALVAEALAKIAWSAAERSQAGALVLDRLANPATEQDARVVARALRASWRFGADTPGLVSALGRAYVSPDAAISEAAAYAAARLGDPRLGTLYELAAKDPRPAVRALACRGLGRLARGKAPETQTGLDRRAILVRRALDVDADVRLAALAALEPFPPVEPVLAQEILDVTLRSTDPGLQRQALSLIGAWRLHHELPAVQRVMQLGPRDLFAEAAAALVRIQGTDAIPTLARAASAPDWRGRASVAEALGAPDLAASAEARDLLRRLLADADARVVAPALESIAASSQEDPVPTVLAHLGASDVVVRAVAASAIPKLATDGKIARAEAAAALRRAWRESSADGGDDARIACVEALADLLGADARADLLAAAGDHSWPIRLRARSLMSKLEIAPPPLGIVGLGRPLAFYMDMASREAGSAPTLLRLMTERGQIDVALATADAPLTVFQITELARQGYFNGLTFHRVVPDFVAQGGCPRGDGTGGPPLSLRCEVNRLPYERGAAGMALSGKDTGGSQFFFTLSPQPHLDGGYTVFGYVTPDTMPVVDALRRLDVIREARVIEAGLADPVASLP